MQAPECCPRCRQGIVLAYRVKATGERVRVCEECEALWPNGTELDLRAFEDLTSYMRGRGGDGLWQELAPL